MGRTLPGASVGRAAILVAVLLLLGTASSAFHSHDIDKAKSCAACVLASTPGDRLPAIAVEPGPVDAGMAWVASWRPVASRDRASLGSRAPPASC